MRNHEIPLIFTRFLFCFKPKIIILNSVLISFRLRRIVVTIFLFSVWGCSGTDDTPQSALRNPNSGVQFIDVTAQAGIGFRHVHGGSGTKYLVETMGSGAAFLDYDNDGDQDLYLVQSGDISKSQVTDYQLPFTNILYRNEGDGTFTDVTEEAGVGDKGYGMGVVVGDIDNDGYSDIFISNFGSNLLYHNNGDGTFTDVTLKAGVGDDRWGCSAAFLDYDGDSYIDLYVTNYLDFTLGNHKFCGDPAKSIRSYCHPDHYNGVDDILYRNNGDGTFTDVTKESGVFNTEGKGLGVICLDYDNDGDIDIYVANDSVRNFLYRNNGDGTFTDVTLLIGAGYNEDGKTEAGMGTDFADFDNDGYFDIFVTNLDYETNTLYHNDGGTYFTDLTFIKGLGEASINYVGWGTNFFDYDNDGDSDLFIVNGHVIDNINLLNPSLKAAQRDFLFQNQGDGEFLETATLMGEHFSVEKIGRGTAFGDYDNDGDVDLFITNSNDTPNFLQNDGGNQNNWLMVKTVGQKSNRNGIGARITVVSGDLTQMDEVKSGSSYLCQNDLRVHFGLGKRKVVDRLQIRWPSGLVETYKDVETNQFLIITEGEGIEEERLKS
jgi:hypothetical protein